MSFDARYAEVRCGRCGRRYVCTPGDDFNSCAACDAFPADAPDRGLCDGCLLAHHQGAHGSTVTRWVGEAAPGG